MDPLVRSEDGNGDYQGGLYRAAKSSDGLEYFGRNVTVIRQDLVDRSTYVQGKLPEPDPGN